jgi:hypothetical protein
MRPSTLLAPVAGLLALACDRPVTDPSPAGSAPAAAVAAAGPTAADVPPYSAVRAPEWDALFDRTSGWTGSDGIFSIPLSGDERPGSAGAGGETFFTFGDTFLGQVIGDQRQPGTAMVNNTTAHLVGSAADPSKLSFQWRTDAAGAPKAWVVPASAKEWYWFQDGVVANGKLYDFALRLRSAARGFSVTGVDLLSGSAAERPLLNTYARKSTPFYAPKSGKKGEMYLGAGVMPLTAEAGAPNPDGYVYVYGTRNDRVKQLVVARVRPADIENFPAYRFWNGSGWVSTFASAAPITDRVSSELSVTPLADGRYLLVFMLDALGRDVAVRYGSSPVGPWGAPISVWSAPEPSLDPDVFTYNAKAHPHLSAPGELLISYNVNSSVWDDHFAVGGADIYRPRFVKIAAP